MPGSTCIVLHLFSISIFHWSLFSTWRSPLAWSSQVPDFNSMSILYFNSFPAMMDNLFSPGISFSWGSSCLNSISTMTFGWHSVLTFRWADLPSVLRVQRSSAWQPSLWIDPMSCDWTGILRSYQETKSFWIINPQWDSYLLFSPSAHGTWDGHIKKFRDKAWSLYEAIYSGKTATAAIEVGVLSE